MGAIGTMDQQNGGSQVPSDEEGRLEALAGYDIVDSSREAHYDDVAQLAAALCGTSLAGIGFVESERYWIKAVHGSQPFEMARSLAVCTYVVETTKTLAVTDASGDARFADKPFVTEIGMAGYLGAPLVTPSGHALGALWVASPERLDATDEMRWRIEALARQVMALLEHRRRSRDLAAVVADREAQRARLVTQSQVLSLVAETAPLSQTLDALAGLTEAHLGGQACTIVAAGTPIPKSPRRRRFTLPLEDRRTTEVLATLLLTSETDPRPVGDQWDVVTLAGDLARIAVTRNRQEAELSRQAECDELTGLPNRRALQRHLQRTLAECRAGGTSVGVLFCDLDRFKSINDSLGHSAGDAYLVAFANRLRRVLRSTDFVARFGGDEFVVVGGGPADAAAVDGIAARIHAALAEPITLGGHDVALTASIGVAVLDADGDSEGLLRDADAAMYQAKQRGGAQFARAESTAHVVARDRLELTEDLRRAFTGDDIVVHYQPVVDIATSAVLGAEALVRWQHPTRGLLTPAEFLPLAEEAGLSAALDEHVLMATCAQMAAWQAEPGVPPIRLYVNLSAASLASPTLAEKVSRILTTCGVMPHRLGLEVTEAALGFAEERVAVGTLAVLRNLGVAVALDDFGTGASSLARLRNFPLDVVKLDRFFIDPLADIGADKTFVAAVVGLAGSLGLDVVAEGIETTQQAAALLDIGCSTGQGFLLGRPEPAEDFSRRLMPAPVSQSGVRDQGRLPHGASRHVKEHTLGSTVRGVEHQMQGPTPRTR